MHFTVRIEGKALVTNKVVLVSLHTQHVYLIVSV